MDPFEAVLMDSSYYKPKVWFNYFKDSLIGGPQTSDALFLTTQYCNCNVSKSAPTYTSLLILDTTSVSNLRTEVQAGNVILSRFYYAIKIPSKRKCPSSISKSMNSIECLMWLKKWMAMQEKLYQRVSQAVVD